MTTSPDSLLTAVSSFLQGIARARGTTTYAEAATAVGLDIGSPTQRAAIARTLDQINQQEHAQGRPMLSAVVCFAGGRRPGAGFFRCARSLGRFTTGDGQAFWREELDRVYAAWDPRQETA